jgi:hypothetical protein
MWYHPTKMETRVRKCLFLKPCGKKLLRRYEDDNKLYLKETDFEDAD